MNRQSQDLYQLLLNSNSPLTARQLAGKLHIFPNAVYRLTEQLINIGLISKTSRYPYLFKAKPIDEGLSLFLLHQNDWFSQQFSQSVSKKDLAEKGKIPNLQEIKLSFVQSRDELMNLSVGETNKANKSVDLLRSCHEIPADLMLSIIEAKRRNVLTRMLIQDYSSENASMVANWIKNGILVRKTSLRHMRLMIYDSIIVYFRLNGKNIRLKLLL